MTRIAADAPQPAAAEAGPAGAPPDMDAFGELGPVLAAALILWLAIVVAVAASV